MLPKMKLYRLIAAKLGCSVGYVRHVDYGYRSDGDKCAAIMRALEAARKEERNAEKGIEKAIKAA